MNQCQKDNFDCDDDYDDHDCDYSIKPSEALSCDNKYRQEQVKAYAEWSWLSPVHAQCLITCGTQFNSSSNRRKWALLTYVWHAKRALYVKQEVNFLWAINERNLNIL